MLNVVQRKSPNFRPGRAGYEPIAIVIHVMDGTLAGTDAWFATTESQVSAHYGIGKKGEVHQYVQEECSAQHAGIVDRPSWSLLKIVAKKPVNPNFYTIGIEHEGKAGETFTEEMYEASSELIAAIASRWNISIDDQHVIPHHAIRFAKPCPGDGVDLTKLIAMAQGKLTPDGRAA
jgi:N-acetyl-anhydromuramyl-L-alanine amidase AmpD